MSESAARNDDHAVPPDVTSALAHADLACTFGPTFFLAYLGGFLRDHCPDSSENLPVVELRLGGGETLVVCHVIGVAPRWVVLAVPEAGRHGSPMAIELVPYDLIRSVCIRTRGTGAGAMGFAQTQAPEIIAPEALLHAASHVRNVARAT